MSPSAWLGIAGGAMVAVGALIAWLLARIDRGSRDGREEMRIDMCEAREEVKRVHSRLDSVSRDLASVRVEVGEIRGRFLGGFAPPSSGR